MQIFKNYTAKRIYFTNLIILFYTNITLAQLIISPAINTKDGLMGYIDLKGRKVISFNYIACSDFNSDGLAVVYTKEKKCNIIDLKATVKYILPDSISASIDFDYLKKDDEHHYLGKGIIDSIIKFKTLDGYMFYHIRKGFINSNSYLEAGDFSNGWAWVLKGKINNHNYLAFITRDGFENRKIQIPNYKKADLNKICNKTCNNFYKISFYSVFRRYGFISFQYNPELDESIIEGQKYFGLIFPNDSLFKENRQRRDFDLDHCKSSLVIKSYLYENEKKEIDTFIIAPVPCNLGKIPDNYLYKVFSYSCLDTESMCEFFITKNGQIPSWLKYKVRYHGKYKKPHKNKSYRWIGVFQKVNTNFNE